MQINRWLHLSRSLWEIPLCCDLFRKRTDQRKFPFTATNNWIVLAVQWPVEYSFAPNSLFEFPVIPEKWLRKEEEETQLQSVLLFKQTQKGGQWRFVSFYRISYIKSQTRCQTCVQYSLHQTGLLASPLILRKTKKCCSKISCKCHLSINFLD